MMSKTPGRKPNKDRAGRVVPVEPADDIPIRRFRENVDIEALETFLSHDDKYVGFLGALHDQAYAGCSFANIMRRFHITLHEVQVLYTEGKRQTALMAMSTALPQIAEDVSEDAKTRMVACPRCDGIGSIADGKNPDTGLQEARECPECKGKGEVRQIGDKHARDLVFESMKLTNQKGPLIAFQSNVFGGNGMESKMESMLKLTQGIVNERVIDAEVVK